MKRFIIQTSNEKLIQAELSIHCDGDLSLSINGFTVLYISTNGMLCITKDFVHKTEINEYHFALLEAVMEGEE